MAANKIAANSPSRQSPSDLEKALATALNDLETNTPDLKVALRPLQFVSAREVRGTLPFLFFLSGGQIFGALVNWRILPEARS